MALSSPPPPALPPWQTYTYTPTERNIFAPSPYKDTLLPMWRFRTPAIARISADELWAAFLAYERQDDFVGMDNARKFLQMGMTRAKRYANHRGGKKYISDGGAGNNDKAGGEIKQEEGREGDGMKRKNKRRKIEVGEGESWEGRKEKEEASAIFKEAWERAKNCEGYVRRKEEFLARQRERTKAQRAGGSVEKVGRTKRKRMKNGDEGD